MEKNGLRIDMLGISFFIAADEDPEYLETLLRRYKLVIENTKKVTRLTDPLKIAIVTGFLLCDEIEKLKNQGLSGEKEGREAEKLALDLIARIDEALPDTG